MGLYNLCVSISLDIFEPLRRYWGYEQFRPLQEKIVRSLLGRRDVCVVMPTGGGKSLCYQLPAALSKGAAIVISPLIALMQDQVAQLSQMGIPAVFLNSTLAEGEQSRTVRQTLEGKHRLLYISPERLVRPDTVEWLKKTPISFFVIDEAHCISEWGHDFRPEYRQLKSLRKEFPDVPIAAFTASATRQVRHDIVDQLRLRNADKYIASFHRPNLRYIVRQSNSRTQGDLLLRALRRHEGESVIVYSPTIKRVGETVGFLAENGISALPYHGRMDAAARQDSQSRWMANEARVLVGTIAFGLGINKPGVRAVVHLSLPKSVEQYYQEAGRAGRDGLPADCILLWQKQDVGLLAHFIGQVSDAAEKERAWQRYHSIRAFVDAKSCRHLGICAHFGETPKWKSCNACDVCGCETAWLDEAPVPKSSKKPRSRAGAGTLDSSDSAGMVLANCLREWRREEASRQGVPAFVIMHDTTLENICAMRPDSLEALRGVAGIGERKTARYGEKIVEMVRLALPLEDRLSPRLLGESVRKTQRLLHEGRSFEEVAQIRGVKVRTILETAAKLIEEGLLTFRKDWLDCEKLKLIEEQCSRIGVERLRDLKDALPEEITYDEIRLVAAEFRHQGSKPGSAQTAV